MHIFRSSSSLLFVAFPCLFAQLTLAFDSEEQWAWIDESCNAEISKLDEAGAEYFELTQTAYSSLGDGITKVGKATLRSFFGNIDSTGLLIQSKYNTLRNIGKDGKKIPYSIYCDGSAFEWVETDDEGNEIEGQWWASRSDPDQPDLYIKDAKRDDICEDAEGNAGNAVSQPNGKAIILCPLAFEKQTIIGDIRERAQAPGTFLDSMVSLSSILLHEMTHVALGTQDFKYDVIGAMFLAINSPRRARKNADTYELFAVAMFIKNSDWSLMGLARDYS